MQLPIKIQPMFTLHTFDNVHLAFKYFKLVIVMKNQIVYLKPNNVNNYIVPKNRYFH
jgi:hypothetical protein